MNNKIVPGKRDSYLIFDKSYKDFNQVPVVAKIVLSVTNFHFYWF